MKYNASSISFQTKLVIAAVASLVVPLIMFLSRQSSSAFPKSTSILSPFPVYEIELLPDNAVSAGPSFLVEGYIGNTLILFALLILLDSAFSIVLRTRKLAKRGSSGNLEGTLNSVEHSESSVRHKN